MQPDKKKLKGRGTYTRPKPRYLAHQREAFDDGWYPADAEATAVRTTVTPEYPKTIISSNTSPDIPFDKSINPYRGCEHGCVYCYARPAHAYMDLSPGIDFESRLFVKHNAAELLKEALAKRSYRCSVIAMGANTDPYQPIERQYRVTREIIAVLLACRHPLTIVTKSWLIERDLDLLKPMAEMNLLHVFVSVTSLDHDLTRRLEPRATAPKRRLQTIANLHAAGVPVGVLFAPVIPFINDAEMEQVLRQARAAGAQTADYIMLRLPHEVKQLFREWLQAHAPDKLKRIFTILRDIRNGRENDPRFHSRHTGEGHIAHLIQQRFMLAKRKCGYMAAPALLSTDLFTPPCLPGQQRSLF